MPPGRQYPARGDIVKEKTWRLPPEGGVEEGAEAGESGIVRDMRIGKTIYLDHQATTPVDQRVLDAMLPYFNERFGNPHSADHALGWDASRAVEDAAGQIAALIGADPKEIVFTSGATEANNLALVGLAQGASGTGRKRVLVSAVEHKSVLALAPVLHERFNLKVDLIPVDAEGIVDLSALDDLINDDVLAVSVMHVNSEIGSVQPIGQIGKIASKWGAALHADCVQAAGILDLTEISQSAGLVSLSAHKMYGPKGVGALYVSHELRNAMKPVTYGGMQQELRSGTLPAPLCVGFGAAAALAAPSVAATQQKMARLRDRLVKHALEIDWPIHLNGPRLADRHPGNANLRFEGLAAKDILAMLQPHVAASTGSACTSGIPEPSYVLKAIGLTDSAAESSVRFSVGRFSTEQDIDDAAAQIIRALTRLAEAGVVEAV